MSTFSCRPATRALHSIFTAAFSLGAFACGSPSAATGSDAGPVPSSGGGRDDAAAMGDGHVATHRSDAGLPGPLPGPLPGMVEAGATASSIYVISTEGLLTDDVSTHALSLVAPVTGDCVSTMSLAIDCAGHAYVNNANAVCKLDLTTGVTTSLSKASGVALGEAGAGILPDRVAFVPKGTLDPDVDALVGYTGEASGGALQYVRVDTTTGAITVISSDFPPAYAFIGLTSVSGGGTFAVQWHCMSDEDECLVQIDPGTGAVLQDYGTFLGSTETTGLAYWAGIVYAFGNTPSETTVTSIQWVGGIATPVLQKSWAGGYLWAASASLCAPVSTPDGGGPILK